jgi:predicted Zn-dependent protease
MIEQIAAAFERKDYRTATELLKQLLRESPQNPWRQFYWGRLHEVSGKLEAAATVYRQLLRGTTNAKIVTQARLGLQRLEAEEQQQRQRAIAQATADPSNAEVGVLVLEPVASDIRTVAAQKFAQIMQIDPYTARLQLPTRGLAAVPDWPDWKTALFRSKPALGWGFLAFGQS